MSPNDAGITAIVLNYARLENVKIIVAHLCSEQLRDTISHVIVWNNNVEHPISVQDFTVDTPKGMLSVVNAPDNSYFQARFLACMEAPTERCLVQDDDYLVSAEAIRALRMYSKLSQSNHDQHPIHLLPPHEHLSTTIRTRATDKYVASFAWLGHGTLLTRTHARSFINLLRTVSNNQDDVMKMADNFFSILLNRRAETWVDPGTHLETGQEKAFTVGIEGDERNWRYIKLAEEYLERITSRPEIAPDDGFNVFPYVPSRNDERIIRAPVLAPGRIGVWSTNIPMLPPGTLEAGSAGTDLRSSDRFCRAVMSDMNVEHYIQHSLACIGDGLTTTVFRSPRGCLEGQWLQFDFLEERPVSRVTLKWSIEPAFSSEIRHMTYKILTNDQSWTEYNFREAEPGEEGSFTVQLELDRPSFLIAARAIVGAGSETRPAWAVVGCLVETA